MPEYREDNHHVIKLSTTKIPDAIAHKIRKRERIAEQYDKGIYLAKTIGVGLTEQETQEMADNGGNAFETFRLSDRKDKFRVTKLVGFLVLDLFNDEAMKTYRMERFSLPLLLSLRIADVNMFEKSLEETDLESDQELSDWFNFLNDTIRLLQTKEYHRVTLSSITSHLN